jgi:eukaryotic-like serine/threonine-protein kinase
MEPRRFGPFVLERLLGQGGMGEVWRARRPGEAPVALKILQDQSLWTMFEDEAQVLARVRHPSVVRVHGLHRDRGRLGLEMELLEGQTVHALQRRLFAEGRLIPVEAATTIATRIADALAHLHAQQIVHRDVAPQNVIIEAEGRVVLLDFGVARAQARKTRTAVGVVKGRPAFMAPEQAAGLVVGPKADVYALGVLTWELLAGRPLFPREAGITDALRRPQPPPLRSLRPEVPLRISALVQAMLVEDEARRIPSDDVLAVFEDHSSGELELHALLSDRTGTARLPAAPASTEAVTGPVESTGATVAAPVSTGPTAVASPELHPFGPSGPTTAPDGPMMSWSTGGSDASERPPVWAAAAPPIDRIEDRSAPRARQEEATVADRPRGRPPPPSRSPDTPEASAESEGSGALLWANGLLFLVVIGLLWAVLGG